MSCEMEWSPLVQMPRNSTRVELPLIFTRDYFKFLFKSLLDDLLLGSLQLLDKSLGAIYSVLDVRFDGLEASKAKDVILLHSNSSSSSSSSSSQSSSRAHSSRSSYEFGEEDNIFLHDFNSSSDRDHLRELTISAVVCNDSNLTRPRRAGIIEQRQDKNAKNIPCSGGTPCSCWGWQVAEECLEDEHISLHNYQQREFVDDDDGDEESSSSMNVRWSECQCPECRKLWMPMSKARRRLHVQKWNARSNNSNLELNRNTRSLRNFALEDSQDPSTLVHQLNNRKPWCLRRSISCDLNVALSSNSNMMNGTKPELQSLLRSETKTTGVIFLHGLFSSSDFWVDSNIIPILDGSIKSRHVILAPDMLGCGRSPRPHDSVYTLSDHVDALENSVVKKYSLESFHIVGHSMGTIPALALAARFPSRVRSLTLIAPVYTGYTDTKQGGDEILTNCNSILSFEHPWSLLVPIFQHLLHNRWPRSFVRDYLAVTHDAAWHIVHNTMIGGSHALVPALRKLRDRGMRVLVIHGTEDTSCPFKQSVIMAQHFDSVVLAPVLGKGHVDVVLRGNDEVLPFLEKEIRLGDSNFAKSSV